MTASIQQAEEILKMLAAHYEFQAPAAGSANGAEAAPLPSTETCYRALVEQIPAVIFMADLDKGVGQAYVSPRIEATVGFSQAEWLEDPIRWYQQVHPADKDRWSLEAADLLLTGKALRSCYRVLARDGRVVWLQCEAGMMRHPDGRPWFIHGIAVDITDLKETEEALARERNVASAILDAVGTLVIVLDSKKRIVRFNRVCEQMTRRTSKDVSNCFLWDLISAERAKAFRSALDRVTAGDANCEFESPWDAPDGRRLISWTITALRGSKGEIQYFIATGADITAHKRLESALLDISEREQRRIGQDLHDSLGQLLTGVAFMSKAQEQKLAEKGLPEAAGAAKIAELVNQAIGKARELAHGLAPVSSEPGALLASLEQLASEVTVVFDVTCRVEGSALMHIGESAARHLYYIAQEAISNAIKHGKTRIIAIRLGAERSGASLAVRDWGLGMHRNGGPPSGMGLDIMRHRAKMIGGYLEISSHSNGTEVKCHFPANGETDAERLE